MMQPMGPPQIAPQQQYPQQPQAPLQWMTASQQQQQQPPQPQYQVPPPVQQPSSAYYYQQQLVPQQQPPQLQQPLQQYPAVTASGPNYSDGVRSLWVGDLQFWMDEHYLLSCFAHTGEAVSAKVIRNKLTGQTEGYGFIEFNSHAAAERNLLTYNGSLMPNSDKNFRMNWALMGAGEKRTDDSSSDYTIFVGDLAAEVDEAMLQELFSGIYPSVTSAKVVTDRITGRSKGYGFVKFRDEGEQLRAMLEMNGRLCGTRPMRIGAAANKKAMNATGTQGVSIEDDPTNTTLFVGNLDSSVTEDHLNQLFATYGQLVHVKIALGKRCGFVQFANRSSAEEALRLLNGTVLGGQSVRISWGRNPSNKQVDPSQYAAAAYYGYAPSYDAFTYGAAAAAAAAAAPTAAAAATQDPNLYYQGYPGYGGYSAAAQPQQPPQ